MIALAPLQRFSFSFGSPQRATALPLYLNAMDVFEMAGFAN
jgi:hypothetical protein